MYIVATFLWYTKGGLMSTLTTLSQQVVLWSQQGAQVYSQQSLTIAHNML